MLNLKGEQQRIKISQLHNMHSFAFKADLLVVFVKGKCLIHTKFHKCIVFEHT